MVCCGRLASTNDVARGSWIRRGYIAIPTYDNAFLIDAPPSGRATTYRCCRGTAVKMLKPHSCALECPILQYSGLLGAWTVLMTSGFSVITNTTRHSSTITNAPRLKTSLMPAPMHFPFHADTTPQRPIPLPWHVATRRPGWLVARVPSTETPEGMMRTALQSRIQFDRRELLARSLTVWRPRAGFRRAESGGRTSNDLVHS